MQSTESKTAATLRRAQNFLGDNADLLGNINQSSERRALDDAVSQLDAHAAKQATGTVAARGQTKKQRELRQDLRVDHMRPIATIAKETLHGVPELEALRMPSKNANPEQLVAHATAMATAATAHAQVFTAAGLPADFTSQLVAAAQAVRATIDTRSTNRTQAQGATGGLSAAAKRGRAALRVIGAIVVPRLKGNDALLAAWKGINKANGQSGGGSSATSGTTTAPVPSGQSAPTPPANSAAAA